MRLTKITDKGNASWNGHDYCQEMSGWCEQSINKSCERCPVAKLLDRLAEYEETGFEPKGYSFLSERRILRSNK